MSATPSALQDDDQGPQPPVILDRRSLLPVTVVGALLFSSWSFMRYLDDRFAPLDEIDERLSRIEDRLVDGLSITQLKMWELEFRRLNPTAAVPDIWSLTGRR